MSSWWPLRVKDEGKAAIRGNDRAPPNFSSGFANNAFIPHFSSGSQPTHAQLHEERQTLNRDSFNETGLGPTQCGQFNCQEKAHELNGLQEAYNTLQQFCKGQEGKVYNLTRSLEQNQQELQQVRTKLAGARQALSSCKDDLFRLQPTAQLSDTEILRGFEEVCDNIVDWIDGELVRFERANPSSRPDQLFHGAGNLYRIYLLQKYEDIGEHLVAYEVHRQLLGSILNPNTYLCGLTEGPTEVLKDVERSMANSKPPKDPTSVRNWRSEALNALALNEGYTRGRERELHRMSNNVFEAVSRVFPIITLSDKSRTRFEEQIAIPAANLALRMQLSPSSYAVRLQDNPLLDFGPVIVGDLRNTRFLDLETRRLLKADAAIYLNSNEHIATPIIALEPCLWRNNEGKGPTYLCQEKLLVQLYRPLEKRHKASRIDSAVSTSRYSSNYLLDV